MPIIHHSAGSGIPEVFLLLTSPDWREAGPKMTYRRTSRIVEGLTGIEDRTAVYRSTRLRQEVNYRLTAQEAADLRGMLATMAGVRIGVPLWVDADRSGWIHAPQKIVSWTDGGSYAIINPGDTVPYAHSAPLLIGRMVQRPSIDALPPYDVSIAIEEDSPWECRIDFATGTTPTTFDFTPTNSAAVDLSRDQLRIIETEQGREAGVAGTDGTPRWGQKAAFTLVRDDAGQLLRFWAAHDGAVKSFTAPAWCRPGADTPQTPHNIVSRFDKDVLEVTFRTPALANCEVSLWQEVSLDEGVSQSHDSRCYFYTFLAEGSTTKRFTSWEHSLTWGGNTYAPSPLEHSGIRQTLSPVNDECDVSAFAEWPDNPMRSFLLVASERRMRITIHEVRVNSSGTVTRADELISGEIKALGHKGDKITGKLRGFGGAFARKGPKFYVQKGCNYVFGDPNCKLSKATFAKTGSIGGTLPSTTVTFTPSSAPTGGYAAKWFAGGWLEVTGTDSNFERRAILDCSQSGGVWTFTLNRYLPATCSGQTATAYPGDDGNYSTCKEKFSNGDNFGGHPFTPAFISTSDGNGAVKTK